MKIFLVLLIACFSLTAYGQENITDKISIPWEELSAPLIITKNELKTKKYQLQEVDLSVDLRQQYLRKNTFSIMHLPQNKFIQAEYNAFILQPKKTNSVGFKISGNGYNASNLNNNGRLKNTAYKDASLYSGAFCPITGLAY